MSLLYLHFANSDRDARAQKLARSGAHILVSEPRWPGFFELAKKEKPYAIAVDFSSAPSHALETADYLAKAKETREAAIYLLRVPADRLDVVAKRLPNAAIVTEQELSERLVGIEKQAQERAREKKEAAAAARKSARARAAGGEKAPAAAAAASKTKPAMRLVKSPVVKPPAGKKPPAKAARKPALAARPHAAKPPAKKKSPPRKAGAGKKAVKKSRGLARKR